METQTIVERDFNQLGMLFTMVLNDMKNGTPAFEDFIIKATKLHAQLKSTIIASTAFLDSFQKIADLATSAKGGTKDIGSALTRLCLRQRSVESHLKTLTSSIMDGLILPLQERVEEWKKVNSQLDKEHSKEYKKYRQELKKRPPETNLTGQGLILYKDGQKESIYQSQQSMATLKLKKLRLSSISSNGPEPIYASMDLNDKLVHFEQMEKNAVRRAMVEERSRYCILVSYLKNVIEEELLITQETSHLQEVMESLSKLTTDPYTLPASSELVISDLKFGSTLGSNSNGQYDTLKNSSAIYASTQQLQQLKQSQQNSSRQAIYGHSMVQQHNQLNTYHQHAPQLSNSQPVPNQISQLNHLNSQTPPSSPSSFSSRKSSCCSISSFNSSSSGSTHSPSSLHHHLVGHHHHLNNTSHRFNSQNLPVRIASIASHDSGFISNADTQSLNHQATSLSEHHHNSITSATLNTREWINEQVDQNNQQSTRPHTISSAFEKTACSRPALSAETFEPIYDSKQHSTPKQDESISRSNSNLIKRKNSLTLSEVTSNKNHTTVIKVEPMLSNYDHQQKFIEELDNVIAGNAKKSTKFANKTSSPPTPPMRKVSLQTDGPMNNQRLSCSQLDTKQTGHSENNEDNITICSDQNSIGSITPTNPVQTDANLYRLSNVQIEHKAGQFADQRQIDDLTATLTRQNSKNTKLSTSLKSIIFPDNSLSHFNNNQLSLTNLSKQASVTNKPPPPPPIRRTSSISNPNAITLGTLGVSTYEEIKTLTLTNLNRFKKNTTNYATYEDVSRLGMAMQENSSSNQPRYTFSSTNQNNCNLSNQDLYQCAGGMNYNTYSGNRTHYRNSCTNLINTTLQSNKYPQQQIYSDVSAFHQSDEKSEEKEKINQLRSEYQQAKNLFENLEVMECNQPKSGGDVYTTNADFQSYLNQQQHSNHLETDSGCGSNSTGGGSQTSNSSITGQLTGHISRAMQASVRRDFIKKDFMETLNAKLSSPILKSSPKFKRRSLSIGHDSEYDYDLNESVTSAKTNSSNLSNSNEKKPTDSGHFSLQQSFMRLVQTNYAKITRSPELTRKFLNSNNQSSSLSQATGTSLMSTSYNSSISNSLFGNVISQQTPSTGNAIGAEVAKEVASIAIKKKQNSYPTSCGNYEIMQDFQQQNKKPQESIYNHTTTIQVQVDSDPKMFTNHSPQQNQKTSPCQEIYQPAQSLQIKSNPNTTKNCNQRRCSQPSMGVKVMNRQSQPNQSPLNQQTNQQTDQSTTQSYTQQTDVYQASFLQNADEKASFMSKLETKLSPTRESNKQQIKPSNSSYEVAARVETWLNKSSPEECRESLLDQIRKGTQLKKVGKLNDRSAPKI